MAEAQPDGNARQLIDEALLGRVCQFNFLPLRYVHDSWLEALPNGSLLLQLHACRRVEQRLSRHLLTKFDLQDKFWFNFEAPLSRVFLLDSAQLEQLVLYAGLTLNARRISQLIARDEVLAIKQHIGEAGYLFALKRAPFLFAAPPSVEPQPEPSEALSQQITIDGLKCFGNVFTTFDTALSRRMLLKLPMAWSEHFLPSATHAELLDPAEGRALVIKLIKELKLDEHVHAA